MTEKFIEEIFAPPLTSNVASRLLERISDGKLSTADKGVNMQLLKWFEENGGKL